ncbi:MAG TPA: SelL-related redox protein [Edaphobacter sp.]|nr:SelL-related redox protein [Edaphobacter sp.]
MPLGTTESADQIELASALREFHTESGRSLLELVDQSPVLLIFLRHFGCAFCRQALDQVSQIREQISEHGVTPVFVHLGSPERAKPYFDYYHLPNVDRISNPDGSLYQHPVFHLSRSNPYSHFLVPAVWKAWLTGALRKYGLGMIQEDAHQMPGVFFLRDRKIANVFRYRTIADEPDYLKLIG